MSLQSILKENKANEKTIIYPGQTIQIPENSKANSTATRGEVHRVVQDSSSKHREYLDWITVDKLVPRGTDIKVTDVYTGKTYMVRRTTGTLHADVETLTVKDTNIMKSIWGGFSWVRRPSIAEVNGRKIACSVTFMPHAGLDKVEGGKYTKGRSGGYGAGVNLDYIKGNGLDGHFDMHFYGSKRHMDKKQDPKHQEMIKIAAGKKY